MKTLAASVFIAGMTVGIAWNGHGAMTLGVYLIAIVVVWLTLCGLFCAGWVAAHHMVWRREERRNKSARPVPPVGNRSRDGQNNFAAVPPTGIPLPTEVDASHLDPKVLVVRNRAAAETFYAHQ